MTTPNAQPASVEIETTITLGKAVVPVVVTLWGVGTLDAPDRHGYAKPVTVGRVSSAGYWAADRQWYSVNGVPIRFDATVERTQHGLRTAHTTAYRGDKDYGLAEATSTVHSHIWKAAPALVERLLADADTAHRVEVARAQREVDRAAQTLDKAREEAHEAARRLAMAEERLANLMSAQPALSTS